MADSPLTWKAFKGLNNRQRPEELKHDELSLARNVDIDDAGRIKRRDGYDDIATLVGNYHSLWSDGSVCLAVKSGVLYRINKDKTETALRGNVGDSTMAYVSVNGSVYYTNGTVIGYVEDGSDNQFAVPTDSFKIVTPSGQLIEYFNGRLYIAKGSVLWFTDALKFNQVDMRHGFKAFPTDIQMVLAVDGGLYVSDEEATYFMSGPSPEKATLTDVCKPAIPGSGSVLKGTKFSKELKGMVAFFSTEDGVCMGLSDGSTVPITLHNYQLPAVKRGAVLVREQTNQLKLVSRLYN